VAGQRLYTANLRFAEYVLELWQMKVKYPELKKPVGSKEKYIV